MSKTVIKCPQCAQKLRIPSDRGEIQVTCSACGLRWFWEPPAAPDAPAASGVGAFFKKVKNAITGRSANILLKQVDGVASPGEAITFTFIIQVGDLDVQHGGFFMDVKRQEGIITGLDRVRMNTLFHEPSDFDVLKKFSQETFSSNFKHAETFNHETYQMEVPQLLRANHEYAAAMCWHIPESALPSFQGHIAFNTWHAQAYLKTSANNPKTDWYQLTIA